MDKRAMLSAQVPCDAFEADLQHAWVARHDRRRLLTVLAALGLGVTLGKNGNAQEGTDELVVANWGGPASAAFVKVWGGTLRQRHGLKMVVDGSGPTAGKIRNMVESGKVAWDVCDASVGAAVLLGNSGLLEEIDYQAVGSSAVRQEHRYKWAVSNYIFSYVLAYNAARLRGRAPGSWKDFWNVKEFPGKRTLRASCIGQLECALLADGVPPEKIYPIDVPRALEKIKEIREHTIFWKTGSQSEDLFRQNEVVMGNMWHNRTNLLRIETSGNINWTWNGGVVAPAVWIVPKTTPARKRKAMQFIAIALEPAAQVELFKLIGMGPSNPAASALIPDDLKRFDPSQPENLAKQIHIDEGWYGANLAEVEAKYLSIISS